MPKDRWYPIVCAVLVAASVFATVPVLEMGTNDDWSYTWVARELAATGQFKFNGWIGAMIGVQAEWAALLIRWFGFSFTLVRLSTLPFAIGCALLLYRLCRSAGLNPSFAMFGTLSVVLSPVFIPVAASYMTDVPGFFFWLACFYCAVRAIETSIPAQACGWMTAAAVAGVAGGTIRQVIWAAPMLVLPAVAWVRRRERSSLMGAAGLWCASAAGIALCVAWFNAQPGVTPLGYASESGLEMAASTVETLEQIALGCLVLMLPSLVLCLAAWRKWMRAPIPLVIGVAAAVLAMGGLWWFDDELLLGNMITPYGMLGVLDLPGSKPEVLNAATRCVLGAVVFVATAITMATLVIELRPRRTTSESLRRFAFLYGPVCLVYTAAITYRGVTTWLIFDRYFIVILPMLLVPLLWLCQERLRQTPPVWGWVPLAVFACFGIALTHDYLAAARTRLEAANAVTAAGTPRTHVSAGLEYDGWTQLLQTGVIHIPTASETESPRRFPITPPYWYWDRTPAVEPVYIVTYSRLEGLVDSPFPPLQFTAWLPPFHRQVLTQKVPEQSATHQ